MSKWHWDRFWKSLLLWFVIAFLLVMLDASIGIMLEYSYWPIALIYAIWSASWCMEYKEEK